MVAAVALALVPSRRAVAQTSLGGDGDPIETSNYSIDLTRGPVLTGARAVGLGGAFAAIAEGVEGGLHNPAAVAYRGPPWPDRWDYWLTIGTTFPLDSKDFYNSGGFVETGADGETDTQFYFLGPGFYLQYYDFGVGLAVDSQVAEIQQRVSGDQTVETLAAFHTFHLQAGYGFLDNQLIVGAGLRVLLQNVNVRDPRAMDPSEVDAYQAVGGNFEAGVMFRPHDRWWRLGASLYGGARTETDESGEAQLNEDDDLVVGDFYLPRHTDAPWSGRVGFAFQIGRPFNLRWISVEEHAADELAELEGRRRATKDAYLAELREARAAGDREEERRLERTLDEALDALDDEQDRIEKRAWRELRERVRHGFERRYLMVSTELLLTGRVDNGVGVESFLAQTVQRSGEHITVSPRLGLEAEVWPQRLKLRAGSYAEPSRFDQGDYRVHGTLGFDLALFNWDVFGVWPEDYVWRVGAAADLTVGYQALSLSIGGWY